MPTQKDSLVIQVFVLLLCLYWSSTLLFKPQPWIFLDGVNLLFHEAGHLLLFFAGEFLMMLGGTLFQMLIPILVAINFWRQSYLFGVWFCLWWIGDNLINIGVYMADASSMVLQTIGHGHDWNWIFLRLNLLEQDTLIGGLIIVSGKVIVVVGLALMIYQIIQPLRNKNLPSVDYFSNKS